MLRVCAAGMIGAVVTRGPQWDWDDQDGGEGHTGITIWPCDDTLLKWLLGMINGEHGGTRVHGCFTGGWWITRSVVALWTRTGEEAWYKAGDEGKFDLCVLPGNWHSKNTLRNLKREHYKMVERLSRVFALVTEMEEHKPWMKLHGAQVSLEAMNFMAACELELNAKLRGPMVPRPVELHSKAKKVIQRIWGSKLTKPSKPVRSLKGSQTFVLGMSTLCDAAQLAVAAHRASATSSLAVRASSDQ